MLNEVIALVSLLIIIGASVTEFTERFKPFLKKYLDETTSVYLVGLHIVRLVAAGVGVFVFGGVLTFTSILPVLGNAPEIGVFAVLTFASALGSDFLNAVRDYFYSLRDAKREEANALSVTESEESAPDLLSMLASLKAAKDNAPKEN